MYHWHIILKKKTVEHQSIYLVHDHVCVVDDVEGEQHGTGDREHEVQSRTT